MIGNGPRIAKLVVFGGGGDTVYLGRGSTITGYGTPERPHAAENRPGKATLIIPDGTPAIDLRPAIETPAGYKWVFMGPMVNVDLPAGAADHAPTVDPILSNAVAGNQFGTLLAHHAISKHTQTRGSLDMVSIAEYIDGWRDHGARIGHYHAGAIVWEDQDQDQDRPTA